ncbi:MAG: Mu transposase C-terminal domain-containing protein [Acidovorax sp.]|uniref:transposase n=1 Tax=Acidovorax sp. TaxID=1872122 RepID=UPI0039E6C06B
MWLNPAQLAGLGGLPTSQQRIRKWLHKHAIPSRPRQAKGGGLEYDCAALPAKLRAALAARHIATAGSTALAQIDPAPVVSFAPPEKPLPAPLAPTPDPKRRPPSLTDKATADARMVLVNMVLDLEPLHGIKRACAIVALQLATGQASADLQATARKANQRARADQVSARTLERYLGIYRAEGWWGLLPAPAPEPSLHDVEQDVAAVLGLYHSRDARFRKLSGAAKEVTRQLGRDFDTWRALYARARRALDKLGKSPEASTALIKARHAPGAQRDAQLPFKWRDTSNLAANDVWLIDGHTMKAKVRHPDHGAPFAPELTICIDGGTRFLTGWSVNLSENVRAVGDALRYGVGLWGPPAILYGDNGAGETAKQMDCPIDGFCARLGITHKTGIPGKPQGHGIVERVHQTLGINLARQFATYQGRDVDGHQVSVRYDIHDPSFVRVYTLAGEFVCDARFDASSRAFFPTPVIDMAKDKRVQAAIKRRQQQIDTALRELRPTVEADDTVFLPEPSTPFVVVPSAPEVSPSLLPSSSSGGEAAQAASGRPFFDTSSDRYEWLLAHRSEWNADDETWLRQYVASSDYEGLADYYAARGLEWSDAGENAPGFKSAL